MDRYEKIEKDVKKFCEIELKNCDKGPSPNPVNSRAIAYGALCFACNYLFPSFNNDLSEWWNEVMWLKFEKKIRG